MSSPTLKASIKDVARLANVSVGTVSRVINRSENVDTNLRNKVCRVSRKLGFVPKVNTRSVVIVTDMRENDSPVDYVSVMNSLVGHRLMKKGVAVEMSDLSDRVMIHDPRTIGVIAVVSNPSLSQLAEIPNLPVITLTKPLIDNGFHSIRADHVQQGQLATNHLIAHGHKRIGFLGYSSLEWSCTERLAGYRQALNENRIESEECLIQFAEDLPLYDIIARWLKQGVTAIINFNFIHPLELAHILCNVLHIKIGQDISLIGLEDQPFYQWLTPPQTAIRQPLKMIADKAVSILFKHEHFLPDNLHQTPPSDILLKSELIERDSVVSLKA